MRPRVLPEAEAELLAAMLYYEDRQVGLGQDFYNRVSDVMSAIAKDPTRFPIYEGNRHLRTFRRATVPQFPYLVVYELREDGALVVAFAHSSRKPGFWQYRDR